jgi:hypothetical protein
LKLELDDDKQRRQKGNCLNIYREQRDENGKINVELWTKWTKATWENIDEIIRRGRSRIIKISMAMDEYDDDHYNL